MRTVDDTLLSLLDAGQRYDVLTYGYPCSSLTLHRSGRVYYARWGAGENRQDAWAHAEAKTAAGALAMLKQEIQRRLEEVPNEDVDEAHAIDLGYEKHPS